MRKISARLFMSLDGMVDGPDTWPFPVFSPDMDARIGESMAHVGALLMGTRTYRQFVGRGQGPAADGPAADAMAQLPKYVVSNSLTAVDGLPNATIIRGDNWVKEVTRLKEERGGEIILPGSPTLIRSLLRERMLDVLGLTIIPLVRGQGLRLLEDVGEFGFAIVDSSSLPNGALGVTLELQR